ncbi:MAG: hypothetical protein KatS3mg061_2021 [Dehalococcoidia bacterium]|nr:MAG: hypothetical protein KatS3mg061_2021 [Dehalococcoidia bacterium]
MDALIGQTLGQYQIVELIGRGGMATVYRGIQTALGRSVAIKVLPPLLAADEAFVARFRREAMVVAGLAHPNILPVYDFGAFNGYLTIVMMYVQGGTLRARLGEPMAVGAAVRLVAQVADALAYAHERGIVHRDVKPANILLARADWALLADFGIAHLADQRTLTLTGAKVGTPEYMSPEQAAGEPVDARSDLYSLGVVLYELLSGRVPYRAPTTLATLHLHLHAPLPPITAARPDLPPGLVAVVERALAKSPAERFASAAEFREALEATLEPVPVVTLAPATLAPPAAPSAPAAATPPRWRSLLPLVLAAGGGGVTAVLCLALLALSASGVLGDLLRGGAAPATPVLTPSAEGTPTPASGALYVADFSSPQRAEWELGDGSQAFIANGQLIVTSLRPDSALLVYPRRAPPLRDFVLEAELTKLEGPNNFGYGVIFRDDGQGNYFFFSVTGNGSFRLVRYRADRSVPLIYVDWTVSNAIQRGDNAPNRLRVLAVGTQIKLFVNDRPLASATDDDPVLGGTGVLVGTTGLRVAVSSFRLLMP